MRPTHRPAAAAKKSNGRGQATDRGNSGVDRVSVCVCAQILGSGGRPDSYLLSCIASRVVSRLAYPVLSRVDVVSHLSLRESLSERERIIIYTYLSSLCGGARKTSQGQTTGRAGVKGVAAVSLSAPP